MPWKSPSLEYRTLASLLRFAICTQWKVPSASSSSQFLYSFSRSSSKASWIFVILAVLDIFSNLSCRSLDLLSGGLLRLLNVRNTL